MARRDVKLDHLANTWLFSNCSSRELSKVARASDEVTVSPGKILCEEGKPGREFFVILSGNAAVKRHGRKIATLGPGQYFGELALLDRLPRSASVISETEMDLLVLSQAAFNGVLDTVPQMSRKLLAAMAERLREADRRAFH
jgi:CRP/FNR family cyclic AMP-dependent transcriptional regulator